MCATSIGVVFDRANGHAISRIINPDFERQLDLEILSSSEYLLRVPKEIFGISKDKDAMTLEQVYRVCEALGPRR